MHLFRFITKSFFAWLTCLLELLASLTERDRKQHNSASRLSAPIGKQQEYFHAVRKSLNEINDPSDIKLVQAHWSSDIIKNDQGDENFLSIDDEPGFDLSEEEIKKFKLWPKGIIPYYIDVLSFNDKVLRDRIRLFLNVINSVTRINFLELPSPPKDESTRWVFFVNRRGQLGCGDHSIMNFTNEGVQHVLLGYDCMSTGGELAEAVLSIAGIPPQHNAPNRDDYIKVVDENILPAKKYMFQKLNYDQWLFYDVKYDFASAGHFHYHKHSVNGRATIVTQPQYRGISMGENNGFSISDIAKLRMLYNYIVKKKENKVPECNRLFMPGPNFKHRRPSFPDNKPRKKPYQYLGLSKEQAGTDSQDKRSSDYGKDYQSGESNYDDFANNETGDDDEKMKYRPTYPKYPTRPTHTTPKQKRPTVPEPPSFEPPEPDEEEKLKIKKGRITRPGKGRPGGKRPNFLQKLDIPIIYEGDKLKINGKRPGTGKFPGGFPFDDLGITNVEDKLKIKLPTKRPSKYPFEAYPVYDDVEKLKTHKTTKRPTTTRKTTTTRKPPKPTEQTSNERPNLPQVDVDITIYYPAETSAPPPENK